MKIYPVHQNIMETKSIFYFLLSKLKLTKNNFHYSARVDNASELEYPITLHRKTIIARSTIRSESLIDSFSVVRNSVINYASIISSNSQIINSIIDSNVKIYSNCDVADSKVGSFTYISNNSHISLTEIGKFCSIGPQLICGYGNHPTDYISTSPAFFSVDKQCGYTFTDRSNYEDRAKIVIGNDVWLGARVFIKDGVKIGNGSVIGAGSVVVKDVPDFAIVGGIPAKLIRYRFSSSVINKLLEFQWWNWNKEKLQKAQRMIAQNDANRFIEWVQQN